MSCIRLDFGEVWLSMARRDDIQQELQKRDNARSILDAAAKEMGFAVNSIRQEAIEKPWFGERVTPQYYQEWSRDDPGQSESDITGPQDFSREASRDDVYGRDVEQDRDQEPDIHGRDRDDELER